MNSYTEIDGVPVAADRDAAHRACCATSGASRAPWSSDYCAVAFLQIMHGVAADAGGGGRAGARRRGSTSSCRTRSCYGEPLADAVATGACPRSCVDRAVRRVLRQKAELGPARPGLVRRRRRRSRRARPRPAGAPRARPASWPRSRSCCWPTTARCRWRRAGGSRWSGRAPTTRTPSSAATRSPTTASCGPPRARAGDRGADPARRAARRLPRTSSTQPGCPISERRPLAASPPRPRPPRSRRLRRGGRRPRRGCSGAARRARAATPSDLRCPASRTSCSRRCSPPARRSCSCWSPAGRTRSAATPTGSRPSSRRSSRARRAAGALAGVLTGRVDPSGRLPVQFPPAPGASRPPTCARRSAATAAGSATSTRRRCSRSATGSRTRRFGYSDVALERRGVATDGEVESRCACATRAIAPAPRSCSSTSPTRSRSVTRPVIQLTGFVRVPLEPGEARASLSAARRPDRVHRHRPSPHRGARRHPPDGRRLQRGHPRRWDDPDHRRRARRRPRPRAHDAVLRRADSALTVRIGLVGYGFGGRRFHSPLIASAPGCTFAGVVTARRRAAPSRAGSPRRTRLRQPGRRSRPPASTRSSSPRLRRRTPR